MEKTYKEVIFYCKEFSEEFAETHNGKPMYQCWPRLPHHDSESPRRWADSYMSKGYFTVTMPNSFNEAELLDTVNTRYQGAKVPQAAIYCEEKDCYLRFDFRADSLVETVLEGQIAPQGEILSSMAFRFPTGGNYYFVPRDSKSFVEWRMAFEQAQKPKTKASTEIEEGVPFIGSYDQPYIYLGAFKCTQDDSYDPKGHGCELSNYAGKTVHLYEECRKFSWRPDDINVCLVKSKMNVKSLEIPDNVEITNNSFGDNLTTTWFTKGGYGTYADEIEIDFVNRKVKIVEREKQYDPGMNCGFLR